MTGNSLMEPVLFSADVEHFEELETTVEVPELSESGIIGDSKMATLGETKVSFKIRDKYYLIYCRTKKRRIKKKQLKRMNSIFAMILKHKEYFDNYLKSIDSKDIEIKINGRW